MISGTIKFKYKNGVSFPNWELKVLNEIIYKKSSNISANSLDTETGIYKIYGATGVVKHISYYQEENCYISIVKDGAGVGRLFYCDAQSSVLGTLDKIKCRENFNLKYIYYLLCTIDFSKYKTGSTIPHIYFKDYSNESFRIPSYDEQRLISTILSRMDSKMELEQNLLKSCLFQKDFLLDNLFK